MTTEEFLQALAPFVPLFQTVIWFLLALFLAVILRKQIVDLLESLTLRIKDGSAIRIAEFEIAETKIVTKTSDISSSKLEVFGNPDRFQLLFKAEGRNWRKSTKAMEVSDGCLIQVSTERENLDGSWAVAEAVSFVPSARVLWEDPEDPEKGRYLSI